ncbi:putative TATA box-binding protein-associated factor RNA polymerase I subunit A [Dioscorea sansibarensis]
MVGIASYANASVKIKVEEVEGEEAEYDKGLIYVNSDVQRHDSGNTIAERHSRKILSPFRKRLGRNVGGKPLLSIHRARLSSLLMKLMKMHSWKEASGVLSILLKGTPRGYSLIEDERSFLVAMELHRQFKSTSHYQTKIRQLFEIRMDRLIWAKKSPNKKPSIQLELALFYISQGNIQEAHNITKSLVQASSVIDPKVNLIHGLILYQLWYSSLPGEMQIKGFNNQVAFDTRSAPSNGCDETEMAESSNDHYAVYNKDSNASSRFASESSVGNGKVFPGCWSDVKKKPLHDALPAPLFYMEGSEENSVPGVPEAVHRFLNMSIFFAHDKLDASLLPLKLKHSSIICEDFIHSHGKSINEYYEGAVKNLQLALHSTPPLFAALLPLVQILLLGDRVGEAFNELEEFSHFRDTVLVYRIKARLLECFCSNQASLISSCYENALRRDPTCSHSLERLIKMHKIGSYSTSPLLEMISLNLDATPGNVIMWGELASCFFKLVTAMNGDYEDCNSTNERSIKDVSRKNIPKSFEERLTRDSWKLRCRWWATHHFSRKAYMQDLQAGAWKLLASKAACASHLYGPRCEFVMHVLSSLRKEDEIDQITVLSQHMLNSMKLAHLLSDVIIL